MADCVTVFFGIELRFNEDQVEMLEQRTHPAFAAARRTRLDIYWDDYELPNGQCVLFVGRLLGKLGVENDLQLRLTPQEFGAISSQVPRQLAESGFQGDPLLLCRLCPDS